MQVQKSACKEIWGARYIWLLQDQERESVKFLGTATTSGDGTGSSGRRAQQSKGEGGYARIHWHLCLSPHVATATFRE